jgi:hemoglobin/transferrin/lactoferrin receptor protein
MQQTAFTGFDDIIWRLPMRLSIRVLALTGTSLLAMSATLQAQQASETDTFLLDPITIIREGEDNITATGGTVLTLGQIETLNPQNLSDLFSRNSSVSVSGGGGPAKKVHVLGMEQSNLAVSVDGVPQPATSWHHTGSNVVDPTFLKRVEVEAGAAAADSGFAAAAGAIRYETVGAEDMLEDGQVTGGRAAISYGSNGAGVTTSLAGYGKYQGFDWFVMANKTDGDNYESGSGEEMLGTEPAATNVIAKMGYEFEDHRIELNFEHGRDSADRLIKMNLGLSSDTTPYPLVVSRDSVSLKYTTTNATDGWDPEASIYFSENDYYRSDYTDGDSTNGNMELEEDTFGGKLQNTFTTGIGKITAGVDFKQHDYFTNNYGNNDRQYRNFSTSQIGIYTQGRFDFGNNLTLSTGARYDASRFTDWDGERFSDTGGSVNGTLAYKFSEGFEVFAGASSTYLGYVIGDYGYVHARTNSFYTDPDFGTGRSQNVKLGANFTQDNLHGGITFFDTKINGQPSYGSTSLTNNPDEYRSRGVTLNANYDLGATRFGATVTKADVTIGGESAVPNSGYFMPIGTMATVYVDHDLNAYNMTVGASVEWASKISDSVATDAGFIDQPSYTVLSTYAEWQPARFKNVAVRLDVDNLLDENYYERTGYAYSSNRGGIDPIYAAGRTVTLGMSMKF